VPLPEPLAPELMVTHMAFGVAVQEQSLVVVTLKSPTPPPLLIVALAGEIV